MKKKLITKINGNKDLYNLLREKAKKAKLELMAGYGFKYFHLTVSGDGGGYGYCGPSSCVADWKLITIPEMLAEIEKIKEKLIVPEAGQVWLENSSNNYMLLVTDNDLNLSYIILNRKDHAYLGFNVTGVIDSWFTTDDFSYVAKNMTEFFDKIKSGEIKY